MSDSKNNMVELLEELLAEYQTHYNLLEMCCMELMGEDESWKEYASQAAGYKIMIETTKKEIDRQKHL